MKRAVTSLLILALAWGGRCAAESVRAGGQDYVRLADWAAANHLELRWVKRDESLQLSNGTTRVSLAVDHRETQVNGVEVWLLFPMLLRDGAPCITQLDARTTLQPVLSPPKNRAGTKVQRVCLDAGHGGKDPGNRVGGNEEKKFTLLLAQEVRKQLGKAGLKVTMTRSSDEFIELGERPSVARRRGADLFVSLHFNAADANRDTVQGAEVYCLAPAGASSTNARGEGGGEGAYAGNRFNERNMFLAYQVQRSLTRSLAVEDRGVRRARFAVLRDATMPATLIEAGFMSHPAEGRKIFTADYRQKLARAIVEGLLAYKKAVERA